MSTSADSTSASPKMSTSSSSSIQHFVVPVASPSTPILRLKNHWKNVKKEWGPLMAAKEHLYDEYTFPPGRYAGQGIQK
ncbi:hypothetical protein N7452_000104 [Penicillium brevicompactum]|uniref:Uncharacterized protein n=1 Tax=Penicillium brevicompactum TaxID=5074 RepID=A0A9W9UPW0_PENBR|nr:hypothetical protein N7452_000104 [Penicillium brevicompactum]